MRRELFKNASKKNCLYLGISQLEEVLKNIYPNAGLISEQFETQRG
jgi:hypothetical protein